MSFESSGDVQTALDNGVLGKPYVAATPSGLDYNSLGGAPVVPSTGAWILDSKGNLYSGTPYVYEECSLADYMTQYDIDAYIFDFNKPLDATFTFYYNGEPITDTPVLEPAPEEQYGNYFGPDCYIDPSGCSLSATNSCEMLNFGYEDPVSHEWVSFYDCIGEDSWFPYTVQSGTALENISLGTGLTALNMDQSYVRCAFVFNVPTSGSYVDEETREDVVYWNSVNYNVFGFMVFYYSGNPAEAKCIAYGGSYDDANQECDCQSIPDNHMRCNCQQCYVDPENPDGECSCGE